MKTLIQIYLHAKPVHYRVKYKETTFLCSALGVSGTTKVFVRETVDDNNVPLFAARMGIALFGVTNRKDAALSEANPFDPDFNDNFAEGIGNTEAQALADLKKDVDDLSKMLFL